MMEEALQCSAQCAEFLSSGFSFPFCCRIWSYGHHPTKVMFWTLNFYLFHSTPNFCESSVVAGIRGKMSHEYKEARDILMIKIELISHS